MHVYLGNIAWRDVSARHADCLARLFLLFRERGIQWTNGTIYGDSLVSRARSVAASAFVRSGADVLLTIDSDIIFAPEDALAICEKTMALDMVGGVYLKRSANPLPACPLPPEIVMNGDQEPVEAKWLSTGFTATNGRVFRRLKMSIPLCAQKSAEPFWPFYMPMVIEDEAEGFLYLSEDWAFCQRATAQGFKCWIDPTVRLGHLSETTLTLEDLLRPKKGPEQAMRLRVTADGGLDIDA